VPRCFKTITKSTAQRRCIKTNLFCQPWILLWKIIVPSLHQKSFPCKSIIALAKQTKNILACTISNSLYLTCNFCINLISIRLIRVLRILISFQSRFYKIDKKGTLISIFKTLYKDKDLFNLKEWTIIRTIEMIWMRHSIRFLLNITWNHMSKMAAYHQFPNMINSIGLSPISEMLLSAGLLQASPSEETSWIERS